MMQTLQLSRADAEPAFRNDETVQLTSPVQLVGDNQSAAEFIHEIAEVLDIDGSGPEDDIPDSNISTPINSF